MSAKRADRKDAIRQLIRAGGIRTQSDLTERLKDLGFEVTQATVSRDIADLGLEKRGGEYVLPTDLKLRNTVSAEVRELRQALNQVVILTNPGSAQSVAAVLDAACLDGVLGTIAGDDTVLIITAGEDEAKQFQLAIGQLLG